MRSLPFFGDAPLASLLCPSIDRPLRDQYQTHGSTPNLLFSCREAARQFGCLLGDSPACAFYAPAAFAKAIPSF